MNNIINENSTVELSEIILNENFCKEIHKTNNFDTAYNIWKSIAIDKKYLWYNITLRCIKEKTGIYRIANTVQEFYSINYYENLFPLLNINNSCYFDCFFTCVFVCISPFMEKFVDGKIKIDTTKCSDTGLDTEEIYKYIKNIYNLLNTGLYLKPSNEYITVDDQLLNDKFLTENMPNIQKLQKKISVLFRKSFSKCKKNISQEDQEHIGDFINSFFDIFDISKTEPVYQNMSIYKINTNDMVSNVPYETLLLNVKPEMTYIDNTSPFVINIQASDLQDLSARYNNNITTNNFITLYSTDIIEQKGQYSILKRKCVKAPYLIFVVQRAIGTSHLLPPKKLKIPIRPEMEITLENKDKFLLKGVIYHVSSKTSDEFGHYVCMFKCGKHWFYYDDLDKNYKYVRPSEFIDPNSFIPEPSDSVCFFYEPAEPYKINPLYQEAFQKY